MVSVNLLVFFFQLASPLLLLSSPTSCGVYAIPMSNVKPANHSITNDRITCWQSDSDDVICIDGYSLMTYRVSGAMMVRRNSIQILTEDMPDNDRFTLEKRVRERYYNMSYSYLTFTKGVATTYDVAEYLEDKSLPDSPIRKQMEDLAVRNAMPNIFTDGTEATDPYPSDTPFTFDATIRKTKQKTTTPSSPTGTAAQSGMIGKKRKRRSLDQIVDQSYHINYKANVIANTNYTDESALNDWTHIRINSSMGFSKFIRLYALCQKMSWRVIQQKNNTECETMTGIRNIRNLIKMRGYTDPLYKEYDRIVNAIPYADFENAKYNELLHFIYGVFLFKPQTPVCDGFYKELEEHVPSQARRYAADHANCWSHFGMLLIENENLYDARQWSMVKWVKFRAERKAIDEFEENMDQWMKANPIKISKSFWNNLCLGIPVIGHIVCHDDKSKAIKQLQTEMKTVQAREVTLGNNQIRIETEVQTNARREAKMADTMSSFVTETRKNTLHMYNHFQEITKKLSDDSKIIQDMHLTILELLIMSIVYPDTVAKAQQFFHEEQQRQIKGLFGMPVVDPVSSYNKYPNPWINSIIGWNDTTLDETQMDMLKHFIKVIDTFTYLEETCDDKTEIFKMTHCGPQCYGLASDVTNDNGDICFAWWKYADINREFSINLNRKFQEQQYGYYDNLMHSKVVEINVPESYYLILEGKPFTITSGYNSLSGQSTAKLAIEIDMSRNTKKWMKNVVRVSDINCPGGKFMICPERSLDVVKHTAPAINRTTERPTYYLLTTNTILITKPIKECFWLGKSMTKVIGDCKWLESVQLDPAFDMLVLVLLDGTEVKINCPMQKTETQRPDLELDDTVNEVTDLFNRIAEGEEDLLRNNSFGLSEKYVLAMQMKNMSTEFSISKNKFDNLSASSKELVKQIGLNIIKDKESEKQTESLFKKEDSAFDRIFAEDQGAFNIGSIVLAVIVIAVVIGVIYLCCRDKQASSMIHLAGSTMQDHHRVTEEDDVEDTARESSEHKYVDKFTGKEPKMYHNSGHYHNHFGRGHSYMSNQLLIVSCIGLVLAPVCLGIDADKLKDLSKEDIMRIHYGQYEHKDHRFESFLLSVSVSLPIILLFILENLSDDFCVKFYTAICRVIGNIMTTAYKLRYLIVIFIITSLICGINCDDEYNVTSEETPYETDKRNNHIETLFETFGKDELNVTLTLMTLMIIVAIFYVYLLTRHTSSEGYNRRKILGEDRIQVENNGVRYTLCQNDWWNTSIIVLRAPNEDMCWFHIWSGDEKMGCCSIDFHRKATHVVIKGKTWKKRNFCTRLFGRRNREVTKTLLVHESLFPDNGDIANKIKLDLVKEKMFGAQWKSYRERMVDMLMVRPYTAPMLVNTLKQKDFQLYCIMKFGNMDGYKTKKYTDFYNELLDLCKKGAIQRLDAMKIRDKFERLIKSAFVKKYEMEYPVQDTEGNVGYYKLKEEEKPILFQTRGWEIGGEWAKLGVIYILGRAHVEYIFGGNLFGKIFVDAINTTISPTTEVIATTPSGDIMITPQMYISTISCFFPNLSIIVCMVLMVLKHNTNMTPSMFMKLIIYILPYFLFCVMSDEVGIFFLDEVSVLNIGIMLFIHVIRMIIAYMMASNIMRKRKIDADRGGMGGKKFLRKFIALMALLTGLSAALVAVNKLHVYDTLEYGSIHMENVSLIIYLAIAICLGISAVMFLFFLCDSTKFKRSGYSPLLDSDDEREYAEYKFEKEKKEKEKKRRLKKIDRLALEDKREMKRKQRLEKIEEDQEVVSDDSVEEVKENKPLPKPRKRSEIINKDNKNKNNELANLKHKETGPVPMNNKDRKKTLHNLERQIRIHDNRTKGAGDIIMDIEDGEMDFIIESDVSNSTSS